MNKTTEAKNYICVNCKLVTNHKQKRCIQCGCQTHEPTAADVTYPADTRHKAMTTEAKDKTEQRTVYAFKFCWCIYESAYATISIHWTEKGAKRAMRAHKKQELADSKYNSDKRWTVQPITIEP